MATQGTEFLDLEDLNMRAEDGALECQIGINVEHPVVVMPHHTKAVVLHPVNDAGRIDPVADLIPTLGIILELAGDLME